MPSSLLSWIHSPSEVFYKFNLPQPDFSFFLLPTSLIFFLFFIDIPNLSAVPGVQVSGFSASFASFWYPYPAIPTHRRADASPFQRITYPITLYLLLPHILLLYFLSFILIFSSFHPPNFTYTSAIGQFCIESLLSLPSFSPSCTHSFYYSPISSSLNRSHSCHCDHQEHIHVCCCLSLSVVLLYTSFSNHNEPQPGYHPLSLPLGFFTLPPVREIPMGSFYRLLTSS